jgi:ABC-type branched-subunit amino acid transport system substrate-binding protein
VAPEDRLAMSEASRERACSGMLRPGMFQKRSLGHTTLALAILVSLVSCRGRSLPPESSDPVLIGVVLPSSGSLGTDGMAWVRGIQVAVAEVNAAGGVLPGRRVELMIEDSGTERDQAVMRAQSLVDRGAVAILGDGGSAASLAIYTTVTQMARVPQVSCCSTSPTLSTTNEALAPSDRFFFRSTPSDVLQARAVVKLAYEHAHCTRLAILHLDDDYGTPFASAIEQIFPDEGAGTVVANVPFTDGRATYATELGMVADATPDCNVVVGYPRNAGTMLNDWNVLTGHPTVQWIGTDGLKSDALVSAAGSAALLTGFWGTAPVTMPDMEPYNRFAARYRAAFGHDPEPFVSSSYDSAALVLLAIASAGSTDGDAIRDALFDINDTTSAGVEIIQSGQLALGLEDLRQGDLIDYVGASGPLNFDELGDPLAPYEVWQWTSAMGFQTVQIYQPADLAP